PTPVGPDPDLVSPGPWGFVAIAFIAVVVVLLIWDMMRRIRRGRYRDQVREELDAEEQAARAVEASDVDDQDVDPAQDDERDSDPGR
ncbi:MAG: hypothetical protein J0I66_10930, partial [Microbacterium sp.]|nr:hypothetical protein [Microbacterium sp.]